MKGADQFQALEEHLNGTVLDLLLGFVEQRPVEFGIEAAAVLLDLILVQLTGLAQPAVGVAVKATPIKKRIDVDGLACQLDAVLLQTSLKLEILLLGSGHTLEAGGSGYRH